MGELNVYFKTIDEITRSILSKLREVRYPCIKYWCNTTTEINKYQIRDIQPIKHGGIDNNICCYNWDIYSTSISAEYNGLEHLVWRNIHENTLFVCIDSTPHCNKQLVLFQDAQHLSEYPKQFIKIPCFDDFDALMDYANSNGFFSFSLDNGKFDKCTGITPIQGASVYKEKSTGHYWYMDMLHKTHYEVFDCTGKKHLGEADLNGCLNRNKEDRQKQIITC